MTNNDILRRLRYAFDLSDSHMMALFQQGGAPTTRTKVSAWLKRDEDPAREDCEDRDLTAFLDGLIVERRGQPTDSPKADPAPDGLTNNLILRKLKIALNLRAADTLELLQLSGMTLSKSELSALFRNPTHKHYRVCQDQLLRNFLRGLQLHLRPGALETQEDNLSVCEPVALPIDAEQTLDLRHRVLWPDEPKHFVRLAEDSVGRHFGLDVNGTLVSVVSLFVDNGKARFRKFATEPDLQGRGYGTLLLNYVFEQAKAAGAVEIGCRARVDTAKFYERFGLCSTKERSHLGSVQYVYMVKPL